MNIKLLSLRVLVALVFGSIIVTIICQHQLTRLYHNQANSVVDNQQLINRDYFLKSTRNRFSLIQSDYLSLDRFLDHRNEMCQRKQYQSNKLPTASVIIVFHNERWSLLLRTIKSLINRSSHHLIEILLIDDASTSNSIKYHLKSYLIDTVKDKRVKLIRSTIRIGLIDGRNYGSSIAIGKILIFLDSHIEVNPGWLEPLLDRLTLNPKRVVSPIVDLINPDNFNYLPVPENYMSGFTWRLQHFMLPLTTIEIEKRQTDPTRPIKSPTTYGGIFALAKSFFLELGGHDSGMKFFSFETIDLSLWIWTCGGNIEIVPCSRLGHVHLPSSVSFPMKKETIYRINSGRVVEIWLKKYRMFYYLLFPLAAGVDRGHLVTRKSHQMTLKCKSLNWYFENVYPSTPFPLNYRSVGQVEHTPSMLCFDARWSVKNYDKLVNLRPCKMDHGTDLTYFVQIFIHTQVGAIRHDNWCLTGHSDTEQLSYSVCNSDEESQLWLYSKQSRSIYHKSTNRCIHLPINRNQPILSHCDNSMLEQKFFFRDNLNWDGGNRVK